MNIAGKPFREWNEQKQEIEIGRSPVSVKRRDVWWADMGVNIGSEQDGGGPCFERPVIVLKVFGNGTCLAAPLTSTSGSEVFYFDLALHGYRSRVLMSQMRVISTKRMSRYIERIDADTFALLLGAIRRLYAFI